MRGLKRDSQRREREREREREIKRERERRVDTLIPIYLQTLAVHKNTKLLAEGKRAKRSLATHTPLEQFAHSAVLAFVDRRTLAVSISTKAMASV